MIKYRDGKLGACRFLSKFYCQFIDLALGKISQQAPFFGRSGTHRLVRMAIQYALEQTALVRQGLIGAIQQKNVTCDLARQMEGAEEIICSAFGECVTACM